MSEFLKEDIEPGAAALNSADAPAGDDDRVAIKEAGLTYMSDAEIAAQNTAMEKAKRCRDEQDLAYILTGKQENTVSGGASDNAIPCCFTTTNNAPDTLEFFRLLYGDRPNGQITITTLNPNVSHHVDSIEEATEIVLHHGTRRNTYFGLATRQRGLNSTQRGNSTQLKTMVCLGADIDVKGKAHAQEKLPETFSEAREFLLQLHVRPSIIINSGHGLYGIWLLEKPVDISTEEGLEYATTVADGFGIYLVQQAAKKGWKLDCVSDLPRMLRAPGTSNMKTEPAVPCFVEAITVVPADNGCDGHGAVIRYGRRVLNWFAYFGQPSAMPEKVAGNAEHNATVYGSAERLKRCRFIQHCIDEAATLPEPEWHAMLSIVSLTEDGEEKAHEWSEAYPGYSYDETEERYKRAAKTNKPCSCRFIRNRFPGCCPNRGCSLDSGYIVKGPITFAMMNQEEQIDRLLEQRRTTAELLSQDNVDLAAYAYQYDTRRFLLMKEQAQKAGVGKREYDKLVQEAIDRIEAEKAQFQTSLDKFYLQHDGLVLDGVNTGRLVIPRGWDIDDDGIFERIADSRGRETSKSVAPAPVFISDLYEDIDSGEVRLDVVFKSINHWKTETITRDIAMNKGKIIALSNVGFPVVSDSAGPLTRYLRDFEAENKTLIPLHTSVGRLGWKGDEFFPYYTEKEVVFIHEDVDRLKLINAFHTQGNYGAWKALAGKMRSTPVARAMLAVSFAAPLVEKLKRRSILLYVWFYSGAGKTAMLKTAISIWGDPDALMGDFNTTEPGLERKAAALCNLPVGIDELMALDRDRFSPEDLIYLLANGHGKTKANDKDSTKTMAKWRTSFIMTGEVEMVTEKSPDGAHNRLITLNGKVIEDGLIGSIVHEVSEKNYGWAGKEYIKYLIEDVIRKEVPIRDVERLDSLSLAVANASGDTASSDKAATTSVSGDIMPEQARDGADADLSEWANRVLVSNEVEGEGVVSKLNADYNHMRNRITRMAKARGMVIGAHTDQLTMIALADMYASISVFKEDEIAAEDGAVELVEQMLGMMNLGSKVDVVENAWNYLQQWVVSNKRTFLTTRGEPVTTTMYAPNVAVSGVIQEDRVWILTTIANDVLDKAGYDHKKSIQGFRERGYIDVFPASNGVLRTQAKRTINGVPQQRVYSLKIEIAQNANDDDAAALT